MCGDLHNKEVLPHVPLELPVHFCLLPLVQLRGTPEKSLSLFSYTLVQLLMDNDEVTFQSSHLKAEQLQFPQPFLREAPVCLSSLEPILSVGRGLLLSKLLP